MNKIFYWSPFTSNVATVKSVINSIESILRFKNINNFEPSIINAVNEWIEYKDLLNEKKIKFIDLHDSNFFNIFNKKGFLRSRFIYWYVFIKCFFPLIELLKQQKPKFLIVHLITSLPLFLFCIKKFDTKLILRISGLPKMNFFRKNLWRIASKNIYKITCPTKATFDDLSKFSFLKDKLEILYDPIINLRDLREQKFKKVIIEDNIKEIINTKEFILSIGRFTKQKNFNFYLNCIPEILKIKKDLYFIFIGQGEEEEKIKKLSLNLKIHEKIFFIKQTDNVHYFMRKAKALVSTSLWEDPGFVIIEAGYNNCTVISSDCPNGPIEIVNYDGGYLFRSNSKSNFIKTFEDFLNSTQEENRLKKIILKKRLKKFTMFHHNQILIKNIII
jgi:glycosyltransferase involved in cell wall biosynthesis